MAVDAVIFDWGGTLTRWHDVDFHEESLALAQAVVQTADEPVDLTALAPRLHQANDAIWGRSRDEQRSSTIADLFTEAGLDHDPELLHAYYDFWVPHTSTDPEVGPLFETLRRSGIKVGVLSNTIWPREWHRGFFERDGVLDLIDADVYTSEIPWTKPAPRGLPGGRRGPGAERPGPLRVRRRPALRRRMGSPERRPEGDPHPAQQHPAPPDRAHRGGAGRRRAPAFRDRCRRRRMVT